MSANNANEKTETVSFGLVDFINRQSSLTINKLKKGVADLPGFEQSTLDSMGSINIVTKDNSFMSAHMLKANNEAKTAKIVDLNKNTSFPLTHQRKKNKNDFYRFLL